jgi:hypothetical protein
MGPEDTLNGCVQAQGVRVGIENWLIMGSPEWNETPDEVKAAAYQAAGVTGWTDAALKLIMQRKCPFMDEDMCSVVLNMLKEWAGEYPLEVQQ